MRVAVEHLSEIRTRGHTLVPGFLVDLAERYLDTDDLQLYECEIWAKYAGAIDYDQPQHRDFGNHFSDVEVLATAPAGSLFGFPRPGDPYWNGQTVRGVQQRYPNIDMTPYEVVN